MYKKVVAPVLSDCSGSFSPWTTSLLGWRCILGVACISSWVILFFWALCGWSELCRAVADEGFLDRALLCGALVGPHWWCCLGQDSARVQGRVPLSLELRWNW